MHPQPVQMGLVLRCSEQLARSAACELLLDEMVHPLQQVLGVKTEPIATQLLLSPQPPLLLLTPCKKELQILLNILPIRLALARYQRVGPILHTLQDRFLSRPSCCPKRPALVRSMYPRRRPACNHLQLPL
eukprot:scaffold19184_cov112-Isochrysis_galbana.AAC.2